MSDTPVSQQDVRAAEVVSEHLPSGYTAGLDGVRDESIREAASQSAPDLSQPEQESSLKLQGGDIHRDLFKIDARARLHQRAATFSHPTRSQAEEEVDLPVAEQRAPGGFRREFVRQHNRRFNSMSVPMTSSFVEFLDLYGSFAGEDLAETEDESSEDEEEQNGREGQQQQQSNETRPLLGRRKSSKATKKGDAGTTKTFFTLIKAFIGTGIMFLPKAFKNGGILFSSMTLIAISLISTLAFHLLLQCRTRYGGGYGEIGEAVGGPKMRKLILFSVTISQLGFVCAGVVFIAQNFYSFLEAVTKGPAPPLSTNAIIALQLVVLIPLSFIRNISKLGPAALLADVCILVGVTYIYWFDISTIARNGIHPTVKLFNPDHYTLTIGSAIFTFEGIGLILPIQSSMRNPQKFEWLLYLVMLIITIIFTSVGVLCYATFGSATRIEIISNYPQDDPLVNAVQFIYAIAVLVGTPVQLFPALRILEGRLFGRQSGKRDSLMKWKKNVFRTAMVVLCILISILGSNNLDRFVALIGSFACVPLVYIYPPLLHYWGVAETKWAKTGDCALMALGVVGMIYTTAVTVVKSFA